MQLLALENQNIAEGMNCAIEYPCIPDYYLFYKFMQS